MRANLGSFTDELVKIAIGKRQLARITAAAKRMDPDRLDGLPLTKALVQKVNRGHLNALSFPVWSEHEFYKKLSIPKIQQTLSSPVLSKDDKKEFIEAIWNKRRADEAEKIITSGRHSKKDIVDVPSVALGSEHLSKGFDPDRIAWRGGLTHEMEKNVAGPRWATAIPSVAADYARRGDEGAVIRAIPISGIPSGPWTKHLRADTRKMRKDEILRIAREVKAVREIDNSDFYERVFDYLPDSISEYKPLPSGRFMRVKGPNLLAGEKMEPIKTAGIMDIVKKLTVRGRSGIPQAERIKRLSDFRPRLTKFAASNPVGANKYKSAKGGLTQAGREKFKREEGSNLKPGVRGAADTPEKMRRKGSFLSRMFGPGAKGAMTDEKGRPTRRALSAQAWGESAPRDDKGRARLYAKGQALLDRYENQK